MTAPTRSKRPEGSYSDGNADMVRGSILIGIAVIIAVVLLYKGFGDDETTAETGTSTSTVTVPSGDPNTSVSTGTGDTSVPSSSTIGTASSSTTVASSVDPASVTVRVANGSPSAGVAGKFTSELSGKGFTTVDAANGSDRNTASSAVYYTGDAQDQAEAVATALGLPASAVAAMPNPPPTEDGGLNGATVLVVIGIDKAG